MRRRFRPFLTGRADILILLPAKKRIGSGLIIMSHNPYNRKYEQKEERMVSWRDLSCDEQGKQADSAF